MSARPAQQADSGSGRHEIAEAYRSLRSTVKFATGERPIHSVLVVDVDRDQRSGVAEQLATAFAEAGDRCILIDTDARTASDRSAGFFDLLRGSEATVLQAASGPLTRIGPGQAASPDALAGDAFSVALDRLIETHGFAIFSSAPLPQFADALAIAPRVDAVILVVTAGGTRRPRAIDARDALERVGARILGVVMVEPKKRWFW
ncbi:MAG TPA: hypothetical protein VEX37_00925 [Thermomicrobiales bacterium]|nr:hypothetical protein [Thermomicrobiales bacterium]